MGQLFKYAVYICNSFIITILIKRDCAPSINNTKYIGMCACSPNLLGCNTCKTINIIIFKLRYAELSLLSYAFFVFYKSTVLITVSCMRPINLSDHTNYY